MAGSARKVQAKSSAAEDPSNPAANGAQPRRRSSEYRTFVRHETIATTRLRVCGRGQVFPPLLPCRSLRPGLSPGTRHGSNAGQSLEAWAKRGSSSARAKRVQRTFASRNCSLHAVRTPTTAASGDDPRATAPRSSKDPNAGERPYRCCNRCFPAACADPRDVVCSLRFRHRP